LGGNVIAFVVIVELTWLWRLWLRGWRAKSRRSLTAASILLLASWPFLFGLFLFIPLERVLHLNVGSPYVLRTPFEVFGTIYFASVLLVLVLVRDRLSPPSDPIEP
jgi:hypothetical protein